MEVAPYFFDLLIQYRYVLLFPLLVIEGPIVNLVAGFLSSAGGGMLMDVKIVFLIALVADIAGDTTYYMIGRYGKTLLLSPERLKAVEQYFKSHGVKTLIVGKFSHGIGWPLMVAAGSIHFPYRKFFMVNSWVSIVKSALITGLGYYFGTHYQAVAGYLGKVGIAISVIMIAFISYYIFKSRK